MRNAVAPVEAGVGKAAALGARGIEIDSQSAQEFFTGIADAVVAGLATEAAGLFQTVANGDSKFSGQVVVAGAGENEFGRAVLRPAGLGWLLMSRGR